jgi:hypothetical protein
MGGAAEVVCTGKEKGQELVMKNLMNSDTR